MRQRHIAPMVNAKQLPLNSTKVLEQLFSDLSPIRKSQILNKLSPFCTVLDTLPLSLYGQGTSSYSSGDNLKTKRAYNAPRKEFSEANDQDQSPFPSFRYDYNKNTSAALFELAIFISEPSNSSPLRAIVGRRILREETYVEMTTSQDEGLRIILPYDKPITIESSRAISIDGATNLQNALLTIKTFLIQNRVEDAAQAAQEIDQQIALLNARFQQSAAALNGGAPKR